MLGALTMFQVQSVKAATFYWDANGVAAPGPTIAVAGDNTIQGGSGTWGGSNFNFTTDAGDASGVNHFAWTAASVGALGKDTIIFGGTAGTVTLGTAGATTLGTAAAIGVNNLTFNTTNYILTGGALRFIYNGTTNGSINVGSGITATINSGISGGTTGGLTTGTADGNISTNVLITGGGTLNFGGGNSSVGFTIDGGTTVQATGGSFSGFNLNSINNNSILRTTSATALQAPSSLQTTAGAGTLDVNGFSSTISNLGGALAVTNSTSTGSVTLGLTVMNNALTHTGVISNGTGKISLATTGAIAQGSGFSSTTTFSTQTLAGVNTYTGFTSLGRGTVALDFSNAAAPASNILYNSGFGIPTGDDGKLIIARPTATVNSVANSAIGSISTLTLTGKASTANSQLFNGLKLSGGAANVLINPGATGGTVTLDLGSTLERSAGTLVNFATTNSTTALSASATISSTAGTASTVLKDANGVAFAVIGGRDWAAKNAGNTSIVTATTTASTPTGFTANADIAIPTVGGAVSDVRLGANTTISTLKFGDTNRSAVHLGGNTLTTGGTLISAANPNSGNFLTGGTLTSPGSSGSEIVIYANQGNTFGLGAVLADGAAATGFTKGGRGVITQLANNTFTGALTVHEGGLIVRGTNTASSIQINGSQTNLLGAQLPNVGDTTAGAYVQLGNADASGSLGSGSINLGVNALLAIKRSDDITLNNNTQGAGGLTQGWSGTTTLVSAAIAKYQHAGDTTVTAGTLKLDYSASNTGIIADNSRLVLGGGTVEYATVAGTTHNDAVRDFTLISGASTINKTGTGAGRLRLNDLSSSVGVAGATLNFTAASIADTDTNGLNGILGSRARFTVGSAGTYDWALSAASGSADTAITAFSAYSAAATTGTNTNNSRVQNAGLTLAGSLTTNTLKIENTSGSTQAVDVGSGNTLTLTAGGLLLTGTEAVEINNGTLRSNTATNSDLIIHQYNSGGLTINSVIANGTGASTLTKSGNGTLTLGNTANTYTGQTFLNGGTTIISANGSLGAAATGAQLNLNNATLRVTADVILSNGAVGTNNRAVNLNGVGGTFDVDATRTLIIGGAIQGPGGLTKTGNGTLDIRSASGYSGPTTVTAGTLRFGGAANPTRSDVTVGASGTIDLFGNSNILGSLSGSGIVTNTGAAATLNVGSLHNDTTFSGQLTNSTNALNLDKWGAGTLTLTGGNNNYTGSTTISGGTLALSGAGALPDTTAVSVSSAAGTFDISAITATSETIRTLAGATASSVVLGAKNLAIGASFGTVNVTSATTTGTTLQQSDIVVASIPSYLTVGSSLLGRTVTAINTGTNTITLNGISNIAISTSTPITVYPATADTTFAGVISGAGGTITKDGSGTLTLSGANTYTGQTTIDRGVVLVTNASALGTTAGGTRINYNGNTSGGRLDISGGAGSITIDENITLAGERFGNNYSSGFRATGGTVNLTNALIVEGDAISEFRLGTANSGTVLNFQSGVTRNGTSGTNTGLMLFSAAAGSTINFNGAIDNNGNTVEFTDGGTNVLNAASTDVGQMQIDYNGVVKLGVNNAFPATSQLRIGLNTGSGTTDNSAVTGTLDMAGYNLSVARIEGSNAAATTATTASRKITNSTSGNSTLTIGAAATNTIFDGVIENGSAGGTIAVTKVLANTQTFSGTVANTYTGDTTVTGGSLILAKTASVNAIGGNLTIGDGATTAGNDIVQLTNSNQIADTSVVTFNGTGANAGILRLNNQSETLGGLSSTAGAGIIENNNAAAGTSTLTVNIASGSQTFSGILRDNGGTGTGILALTKDGAGTQVLTGTNTYTGATTVNNGALQIGNAGVGQTGSGAVTVASGGTILGTGTVRGNTFDLQSGSILRPGDGVADSNHGTLTFTPASASSSTSNLQGSIILGISMPTITDATFGGNALGSVGYNAWADAISGNSSHDRLVFGNPTTGTGYNLNFLTTTGSLQVQGSSFTPAMGQAFNLLDWSNLVTTNFSGFSFNSGYLTGNGDEGTDLDLPDISSSGLLWDFSRFTTSGVIVVVPEPSRALLILFGLAGLMLRRRRL